jgi:chlorite dismutase
MTKPLIVTFAGGPEGLWTIESITAVTGESLATAQRLAVVEGEAHHAAQSSWRLRGATSNSRYADRHEATNLRSQQEGLNRSRATMAALIPIRKTVAWWDLAQDERREIFEERSRHMAIGTEYLPAIARRLHHCREFGEPFDFLTWFEFAPEDAPAFDDLVSRLRSTPEWQYVDWEVDIRLSRR